MWVFYIPSLFPSHLLYGRLGFRTILSTLATILSWEQSLKLVENLSACYEQLVVADSWIHYYTSGWTSSCTCYWSPTSQPTLTAVTLREAWSIHCMMTMQFAKLQASWNSALKKPSDSAELLISYWWRPDKCTRLTIPMTFLSPALSHFFCSASLYVSVSWHKSYENFKCAHLEDKGNCFQQCISLQISTVPLSLLPGNSNKAPMPANYSFTLCDSWQSSPILLASHQSLLMCLYKKNRHANLRYTNSSRELKSFR